MYVRLSIKKIGALFFGLMLLVTTVTSCNGDEATPKTNLVISEEILSFNQLGAVQSFQITANKPWTLTSSQPWVIFTPASGGAGTMEVEVKAGINTSAEARTATIIVQAGLPATEREITVSQIGNGIAIPADQTGMTDDAMALAAKMELGWNLGNSLEATSGPNASGIYTASETMWGNAKTTQALIDGVKAAGFNTIRIPTAWSGYIVNQTTHQISDAWLTRVKEVVGYCVNNNMYAIINIHWDGGWLENNPTYAKQAAVNAKQKALWEQIAVAFRDYDQHLLFAGTNEVHFDYGTPTAEHIAVHQSYIQTFVDAVRSTGGKNVYRNLIVQSYNTNIGHADTRFTMPVDPTTNRMMAEVHFYDPYEFTLDPNSTKYNWGANFVNHTNTSTWGQEAWVDSEFAKMKVKFVNKNIPVILGEYGVMLRASLTGQTLTNHVASRNHYLNYVTKKALANGLIPVYWDNGPMGNNSSGLFNRTTGAVVDTGAVQAIVSALD